MRISDWSSDVCSSDLFPDHPDDLPGTKRRDDDAAMLHRHAMRHAIVERPKGGIEQKNAGASHWPSRSEEHTSELQSLMRISYAVFCLKKKKTNNGYNKQKIYTISKKHIQHTNTQ